MKLKLLSILAFTLAAYNACGQDYIYRNTIGKQEWHLTNFRKPHKNYKYPCNDI